VASASLAGLPAASFTGVPHSSIAVSLLRGVPASAASTPADGIPPGGPRRRVGHAGQACHTGLAVHWAELAWSGRPSRVWEFGFLLFNLNDLYSNFENPYILF
jgi:hypothetical protein